MPEVPVGEVVLGDDGDGPNGVGVWGRLDELRN